MIAAHMDEVGFIITNIGDDGMLKFRPVGGIDPRILPSKRVRIGSNGVPGILGIKAIHLQEPEERKNAVKIKQMYIDIGAKNKEQAEKVVKRGDYAVFDSEFVQFGQNKVKAKALDDRVGCAILTQLIKEEFPFDFYACFTVQEEVGLRGAEVAAYHVQPDLGIVIEGTTCSDVAGVDDHLHITRMGKGPAISIADRSSYGNKDLVKKFIDTAKNSGLPFQIKEGMYGGNDAGKIHISREGVATAVISVPCRYIHSPSSVMDLEDYHNTFNLVNEFLKGCESK
jgi:endoglucanase